MEKEQQLGKPKGLRADGVRAGRELTKKSLEITTTQRLQATNNNNNNNNHNNHNDNDNNNEKSNRKKQQKKNNCNNKKDLGISDYEHSLNLLDLVFNFFLVLFGQ